MLRYIEQQGSEAIEIRVDCDVCMVERPNTRTTLSSYLDDGEGGFTNLPPILCPDHGRELGLIW